MDILVAAVITALIITIEHLLAAHVAQLWRYALGVAAFMLPFTAVALMRQWYEPLILAWVCAGVAANMTALWHGFDAWKKYKAEQARNERNARGQIGLVKPED